MAENVGPLPQPESAGMTFGEPADVAGSSKILLSGHLWIAKRHLSYRAGQVTITQGRVRMVKHSQQLLPWIVALLLLWNVLWAWIGRHASKKEG